MVQTQDALALDSGCAVIDTFRMPTRNAAEHLEADLQALAPLLRADDVFADELYCALCNARWSHEDGTAWSGTWRIASQLVANLRGVGEHDLEFYYSPSRGEGTITSRVAAAMKELGWTGISRSSIVAAADGSANVQA